MPIARQVLESGAQRDRTRDVGRARLELVRDHVVGRLLERDRQDHVPAAVPGRHGLQQRGPAPERADARGPEGLVAREGVEVAAPAPARPPAGAARPARRPRRPGHPARAPSPRSCGRGFTVPSAFETCPTETSRVRGESSRSSSSRRISPSSVMGATFSTPPVCSHRSCQGHDVGMVLEARDQDLVARLHPLASRTCWRPG